MSGYENTLRAYKEANRERYRFFIYGEFAFSGEVRINRNYIRYTISNQLYLAPKAYRTGPTATPRGRKNPALGGGSYWLAEEINYHPLR